MVPFCFLFNHKNEDWFFFKSIIHCLFFWKTKNGLSIGNMIKSPIILLIRNVKLYHGSVMFIIFNNFYFFNSSKYLKFLK